MAKPQANSGWNVDLFHCFPGSSVFESIFSPCVLYGRAEERLRNPYFESYDGSNAECKSCCQACPVGCLYVKSQRRRIREKYGIEGSSGSDCFTATCCYCCALVQHDNEIESRGPKRREAVNMDGYRPNTNSMYMPGRASNMTNSVYTERGSMMHSINMSRR